MDTINKQYERLGFKTYILLTLRRAVLLFVVILAIIALSLAWNYIPVEYSTIAQMTLLGLGIAFVLLAIIIILLGFLEYRHYKIYITDETIKIYRGLISEEEVGLPFRRVKQANIERGLMDQILGVSQIRLTVTGDEDGAGPENKYLLTALDKNLAQEIQNIILKEAEVEEINVDQNSK